MIYQLVTRAWLLIWCTLFISVFSAAQPTDILQEAGQVWQPDEWTRERAKHLRTEDISCLVFGGNELTGFQPNGFVEVDDPALIDRFVLALRTAVEPALPPVAPGEPPNVNFRSPETNARVDVYLKPGAKALVMLPPSERQLIDALGNSNREYGEGKRGPYLRFRFDSFSPPQCFGPRFWSALHSLSKHQAAYIRRTATQYKSKVVAFRFANAWDDMDKHERVSNSAEVTAFVDALSQVDERAYQWQIRKGTHSVQALCPATELELRDGRRIPLVLLVSLPHPNPKNNPPWLQVLYKSMRNLNFEAVKAESLRHRKQP